jgi:dihydroneopterin aldolase
MITSATVSVAKLNPPIGGNVQEVAIILSKER